MVVFLKYRKFCCNLQNIHSIFTLYAFHRQYCNTHIKCNNSCEFQVTRCMPAVTLKMNPLKKLSKAILVSLLVNLLKLYSYYSQFDSELHILLHFLISFKPIYYCIFFLYVYRFPICVLAV